MKVFKKPIAFTLKSHFVFPSGKHPNSSDLFNFNKPGSWQDLQWASRCRWRLHRREWCGCPGRWRWFPPVGTEFTWTESKVWFTDKKHGNVISKLGINIQTNLSMLENSDTGAGGAKVDTNSALLCHFSKLLRARSAILKCWIPYNSFVLHIIVPWSVTTQKSWHHWALPEGNNCLHLP